MDTPHADPGPARRVLVTGGAGFIGSHLVQMLLKRSDRVTVIDNLSTGRRSNLPDEHPHLRFIEADLADALDALGSGERFDQIYHLAAAVGVRLVMDQTVRSIETNVEQTAALLRFARTHGPDGAGAPTLLASSSEVYGKSDRCPFREDDDAIYGPTTVSRWSYALGKAIDEHLALAHHADGSVPCVVVRLFNTIGPRQIGNYGMVVPRFVQRAMGGQDLEVHGDGSQTRCFCDVRDVVPALTSLLDSADCHGRVFNLGSDREISIRDLAETVIRVTESSSAIRLVPYDEAYGSGFEDLARRVPDLSRIREAIAFNPKITLAQTIADIAREMHDHHAEAQA